MATTLDSRGAVRRKAFLEWSTRFDEVGPLVEFRRG
jgi:hypothetical protein